MNEAPIDRLLLHADESAAEDPRLIEAVREYQAALEAGLRPSRKEFLARYPEIAVELAECIDGLSFLLSAVPRLQGQEGTVAAAAAAAAPVQAEDVLGDFHLVREIGRGGMGVVYEAVQISLGRHVALKVLPFAATLDARQLQRFENEARAAAGLHHSNIVPVFAVGSDRGVHYYAMQFIDGQTLATVIARLRHGHNRGSRVEDRGSRIEEANTVVAQQSETLPGNPRSSILDPRSSDFFRTAAQLGVQAAEALEYAHQMGVVHRDVKPANLLLDSKNTLWVTDFGLARFSAHPELTAPGDLVGTLRYMSPEQAAGKPVIDPRSDVYSLGATLYELLTQSPAFSGRDRHECLRQILEEEPVLPRRLNKAVPVELETIVLKAMAKQPEDRYGSAKDLADDLRRFLEDKPVLAQRPGVRERLAKWAWRRRAVVTAAMLGLVAAVLILAATTWRISLAEADIRAANDELRKEKARTTTAWEQEAAQRDRVERNYRQARKVLDLLTRLGVEDLADKPELQALRQRLLTELLAYYTEFIEQQHSDSSELVETQLQVAEILDEMGKKAESLAAFEKAMRDRNDLPEEHGPSRPGFGRFPGPPRGLARPYLLAQAAVQKELKLTAEQVKRVAPVVNLKRKPPTKESLAAAEKALAGVLTPEQNERLGQITRQMRGIHALLDPEIATALELTRKQKDEIHSLLRPPRPPRRRGGGPGGGGGGWGGRRPEMDRKPNHDKVLAVLSDQQRQRWQSMLGEPFQGEIRFGPPPRPGPFSREGR
jgi:serine/threonine protein kinase